MHENANVYGALFSIFLQVRNEFYKDTQGVILVYDSGNKKSFENLEKWLDEMKNELSHARDMDNVVFCVCANKVSCNFWKFRLMWFCSIGFSVKVSQSLVPV